MTKPLIKACAALGLICAMLPAAHATDDGPVPSFSKPDAYLSVEQSVESLTAWAMGEYAEHDIEGLFQRLPKDGSVIQATISLAKELRQMAEHARMNGDADKADAYLFSAEATARYAAQMPHLLEDRIAEK